MSFDEIFDLTAGVYFNFYNIYFCVVTVMPMRTIQAIVYRYRPRIDKSYDAIGIK